MKFLNRFLRNRGVWAVVLTVLSCWAVFRITKRDHRFWIEIGNGFIYSGALALVVVILTVLVLLRNTPVRGLKWLPYLASLLLAAVIGGLAVAYMSFGVDGLHWNNRGFFAVLILMVDLIVCYLLVEQLMSSQTRHTTANQGTTTTTQQAFQPV
jgi:ABC-type Fe3+ transport system permease subunit